MKFIWNVGYVTYMWYRTRGNVPLKVMWDCASDTEMWTNPIDAVLSELSYWHD